MALVSVSKVYRLIKIFEPLKETFLSKHVVLLKNSSVHSSDGPWACLARRFLGSSSGDTPQTMNKPDPEKAAKMKKKGLKSPQITLIMPDEHVTNDTLENAEKMAKRRNLKLVKILDFHTKSQRPLYKLMSNLEFVEETKKTKEARKMSQKSELKDEKLFIMSSKINEHDFNFKINQMQKLAKKKHPIRVFVSQDGNPKKADELVTVIEEELKSVAKKNTQVKKATTLRLQFIPILKQDEINNEDESNKDIKMNTEVEKKNTES